MIINADSREYLKTLPDNHFDSCVTDPPYHLQSITKRFGKENSAPAKFGKDGAYQRASKGFMGKEWDGGDIAFDPTFWTEVCRVLKPGAHLLAFGSPRTYHRMACAIEDAGFEVRDSIHWLYASGFPKSHNVGNTIDKMMGQPNRGRAIPTASTHLPSGKYSEDKLTSNPVERFIAKTEEAKPWEGWGSALKPAHEPIVLSRKPLSEKNIGENSLKYGTGGLNIDACRIPADDKTKFPVGDYGDSDFRSSFRSEDPDPSGRFPANLILSEEVSLALGSAARFFYCPKVNSEERNAGLVGKNTHPTLKPIALMSYLVRLVTPPNGIVLDPFCGSGSTGIACIQEGFQFLGVEREKEYFEIAEARLEHWQKEKDQEQNKLW